MGLSHRVIQWGVWVTQLARGRAGIATWDPGFRFSDVAIPSYHFLESFKSFSVKFLKKLKTVHFTTQEDILLLRNPKTLYGNLCSSKKVEIPELVTNQGMVEQITIHSLVLEEMIKGMVWETWENLYELMQRRASRTRETVHTMILF